MSTFQNFTAVLLLLIAGVTSAVPVAADSQLQVVLACDHAHPKLGEGFEVNEWAIRSVLADDVASSRLKLLNPDRYQEGGAPPLTRKLLLEFLTALPVQPDDALIVYLACERSQTDKGEERFRFSGDKSDEGDGWFTREEILAILQKRDVRLVGLITDGGSEYIQLETQHVAISTVMPPATETSPLCEKLFFKSNGVLNVASAAAGETAGYYDNYTAMGEIPELDREQKLVAAQRMGENVGDDHDLRYGFIRFAGNPLQGGYFTESLVEVLRRNSSKQHTWEQLLAETDTELQERIGGLEGKPQTVQLLDVPGREAKPLKPSEGTLHMIIACDTADPGLGEGFEINEGLIRSYFIDAVATRSLRFYAPWSEVDGDRTTKLTGRSLLEAVENIKVQPNDTLMVYVACHGFWDNDENEQWFRFENASDSALERKSLIDRIKSRNTRLGMLVTDACTNYEMLPANKISSVQIADPRETTLPLCQALFFDQEGLLDLSSSSSGQFTLYHNNYKDLKPGKSPLISYGQSERVIPGSKEHLVARSQFLNGEKMKGGLFTESMVNLLETNKDQKYDWKKFTDLLRKDVEERFDEEIPDGQLETGAGTIFQDAQTVAVNELPGSLEDTDTPTEPDQKMAKGRDRKMPTEPQTDDFQASRKFGVSGMKGDDGGFLILEVIEDSRASRHGLKVGEVIEMVNNQPVNTPKELEEALANAAATFRITVGGTSFVVRP